jgi:divalent metal cation (Fe/Co/Zn/Cd) transporter
MQGSVRIITIGQAVISFFFLDTALFSLPSELDAVFFIFNILAGVSSAAFIVYTSANPVPGAEDTTLMYFYVLLAANCVSIVIAFIRCRLANRRNSLALDGSVEMKKNKALSVQDDSVVENYSQKTDLKKNQ